MDYLILTISGNEQEKTNVLKNINMLKDLPDNFTYFVYTNYKMPEAYKNLEFVYFNEMFYKIKHVIEQYDYLLLLDDDDNFTTDKIKKIQEITEKTNKSYIHNYAYYDNAKYNYNGINNNNSCITIKTSAIDFDLFLNTKSLSDYLLWLPVCENNILSLQDKLTYIHNKEYNFISYRDYMLNRYRLRLNDLLLLIDKFQNKEFFKPKNIVLKRLQKECAKYSYILNEKTKYIPDLFTLLHKNKPVDYFIKREYDLRYGIK